MPPADLSESRAPLQERRAKFRLPSAIPLFLAVALLFAFLAPHFLSPMNLSNILLHSSPLAILALGMSLVMLTNGIDLSVGSLISLVSVVTAGLLGSGLPIAAGMLLGILTGTAFGLASGLIVARIKLPPFIVTLAAMAIAASLALVLSGGDTLYWETNWFNRIAVQSFAGIPVPFWIVIVLFALMMLVLHLSPFGQYVYGLGNNEEALRLSGVAVRSYKTSVYAVNGTMAGIAGVLITSRIASGLPIIGMGWEFEAIAAAAIGGITFVGGKGHPGFALLSALTITMLMNGLGLMGFTTPWQYCAIGVILVLGMVLNRVLARLRLA